MSTCQYAMCDNTIIQTEKKRYCSRACQVAAYRREYSRRTYVVLTLGEHQQLADLAAANGTTIDEIAAEMIREGLER